MGKNRLRRTQGDLQLKSLREVLFAITFFLYTRGRRGWFAVQRVGFEELCVESCHQCLRLCCVDVFDEESLVLLKAVAVFDLCDGSLLGKCAVGRDDELCLDINGKFHDKANRVIDKQ